jgi:hypothetical protein
VTLEWATGPERGHEKPMIETAGLFRRRCVVADHLLHLTSLWTEPLRQRGTPPGGVTGT